MREGRSPMSRKTYMESKEMHQDKSSQMRELEKYLQELSADITELIEDASPEEKQLMQQKIGNLATKIK
jgi:predicted transcriptional regulator